jgi:hypothetical protein
VALMFGRSESARERVLIRVIDSQQQLIHEILGKMMELSGHPPAEQPPFELPFEPGVEPSYSALGGLPPGYEEEEHSDAD